LRRRKESVGRSSRAGSIGGHVEGGGPPCWACAQPAAVTANDAAIMTTAKTCFIGQPREYGALDRFYSPAFAYSTRAVRAVRHGCAELRIVPGAAWPAGYRPAARDWRCRLGCPVMTATHSTGQVSRWPSIKRNLISAAPRRWPQLSRNRAFSRRSWENSAAGIGCRADPASRVPLPLRQLRSIEGEMTNSLAIRLNGRPLLTGGLPLPA